jgi:hypothetical protein
VKPDKKLSNVASSKTAPSAPSSLTFNLPESFLSTSVVSAVGGQAGKSNAPKFTVNTEPTTNGFRFGLAEPVAQQILPFASIKNNKEPLNTSSSKATSTGLQSLTFVLPKSLLEEPAFGTAGN